MLIKKTFSNVQTNRDKVTNFMIKMTDQFKTELESSKNIKETIYKLQEFIMILQTVLTMDDSN